MGGETSDRADLEARFAGVFAHLGLIRAYASRRGANDADEIAAEVMAPEEELGWALELDAELEAALASLSPTDREALLLVAWEDLTPAAAAASLGMSPAAFRVRLHRARHRLRRALETRARPHALDNCQPSWSGYDV